MCWQFGILVGFLSPCDATNVHFFSQGILCVCTLLVLRMVQISTTFATRYGRHLPLIFWHHIMHSLVLFTFYSHSSQFTLPRAHTLWFLLSINLFVLNSVSGAFV